MYYLDSTCTWCAAASYTLPQIYKSQLKHTDLVWLWPRISLSSWDSPFVFISCGWCIRTNTNQSWVFLSSLVASVHLDLLVSFIWPLEVALTLNQPCSVSAGSHVPGPGALGHHSADLRPALHAEAASVSQRESRTRTRFIQGGLGAEHLLVFQSSSVRMMERSIFSAKHIFVENLFRRYCSSWRHWSGSVLIGFLISPREPSVGRCQRWTMQFWASGSTGSLRTCLCRWIWSVRTVQGWGRTARGRCLMGNGTCAHSLPADVSWDLPWAAEEALQRGGEGHPSGQQPLLHYLDVTPPSEHALTCTLSILRSTCSPSISCTKTGSSGRLWLRCWWAMLSDDDDDVTVQG